MNDSTEVLSPREMHPAFYGCFDWHSSVHGHWMLVRLLKTGVDLPNELKIRKALSENLTPEAIQGELTYFSQAGRKSFERTYGWAWLLKLAEELESWEDPDGRKWSLAIQPLADLMVSSYQDFLPKQDYPIRTGVHPNTAFGIAFALDYARNHQLPDFETLLIERARSYYEGDRNAPAGWEPGGEDFFSPSLMEADLMSRVYSPDEFGRWLLDFLPDLSLTSSGSILEPVEVSDRTDPKIVHLDGLNLSRAWCMLDIAYALPQGHPYASLFLDGASRHAHEALKNIISGQYEGEHWLASFAVYLLTQFKKN